MFRTFLYAEPKAYVEPCQTSVMEHLGKIVNSYNYFCKLIYIFSQYRLLTFSTEINMNYFKAGLIFTPKVFYIKKYGGRGGLGVGAVNFDIPQYFFDVVKNQISNKKYQLELT